MPSPLLVCADSGLLARAQGLVEDLQLPPLLHDTPTEGLFLELSSTGLRLCDAESTTGCIYVEFSTGKAAHRQGQKELIVQALGRQRPAHVVDATAGLGRDAFVLASAGIRVTLFEQHPVIHALLEDGLQRARQFEATQDIAQRMSLERSNAIEALPFVDDAEVIYLDPMYPHREKSAAVKKEMRLFQQLLGDAPDASDLLVAARTAAKHRVVVKRPLKGGFLANKQPNYSLKGRSTRFDIYLSSAS